MSIGVKNEKRIPKEGTPLVAPTDIGAKLQNGASEAGVRYYENLSDEDLVGLVRNKDQEQHS